MDAIIDFYDPEAEFHEDPRFPEAGVYKGPEAARDYYKAFGESFDEFTFEAEDFIDVGEDKVLILFRIRTRGKGSGAQSETESGWIWTIRNGKAARVDAYFDRNEALAAAGLK
jgi:ketosteroid isomerase-like protein